MDQNNLSYLQKSLDYLGFGTRLNDVLETEILKGERNFSIGANQRYIPAEFRTTQQKEYDHMHFELKFARSAKGDVYFLNAMETSLSRYNGSTPLNKRFELDQQNRVSALQAYKLLCGLSFEKPVFLLDLNDPDGKKYNKVNAWLKLDFNSLAKDGEYPLRWYLPEHGFDLVKSFGSFPFENTLDQEKITAALQALRFGNLIALPLEISSKVQQVYVSANPETKNLDIFDEQMQKLSDAIARNGEPVKADPSKALLSLGENQIDIEQPSKGLRR